MRPEALKEINKWIEKYPKKKRKSAVIAALRIAQHENQGYLTIELMDEVAEIINIPKISVYEVATFYSMYEVKPVGKIPISICTNLSCMLSGSDEIVAYAERKLGIKTGESSLDGMFYLKCEEECLAACSYAPVVQINHKTITNVTVEKLDKIIEQATLEH